MSNVPRVKVDCLQTAFKDACSCITVIELAQHREFPVPSCIVMYFPYSTRILPFDTQVFLLQRICEFDILGFL